MASRALRRWWGWGGPAARTAAGSLTAPGQPHHATRLTHRQLSSYEQPQQGVASVQELLQDRRVWLMGATLLGCGIYGYNLLSGPKVTGPPVYLDFGSEGRPLGRVVVGLYGTLVPEVVENFRGLATHSEGFGYQGSPVHHVVKNYVVMAGDVTHHDGTGGMSVFGPQFAVRSAEARLHRGTVAMVRDDAGGGVRSQFFIACMPMTTQLSKQMVACGKVLSGMDVVDAISALPAGDDGRPLQPVTITGCGTVGDDGAAKG